MTRIDFYLLKDDGPRAKAHFACRLVNKAFLRGHEVYFLAPDAREAGSLDQLLWTFHPGSFVPHGLADQAAGDPPAPVLIGHGEPPEHCHDLLVSLGGGEVPPFFSRFQRLAEVVGPDPEDRRQARERYRFYRDRGYDLKIHEL